MRRRSSRASAALAAGRGPATPPAGRAAGAEHEVGGAGEHRAGDAWQVGGIEGTVAVHEADHPVVGVGGEEAGPARRAEAPCRLGHDQCAEDAANGPDPSVEPLSTTMGRKPARHGAEQTGEGGRFVEDGDDHVGHSSVYPSGPYRTAAEVLTIR